MRAIDAGVALCDVCHALEYVQTSDEHALCKRCGGAVHLRKPNSLVRTWALLLTSVLLYIPANVLPIMMVHSLGQSQPSTIMAGVIDLIQYDMVPIALVVFIASIVVPSFKLIGLALIVTSVQLKRPLTAKQCSRMYRFIEIIGRWSMLDIFVITVLVASVRFGNLATISADFGAIAFCAVVILTMLAALTFDARLIWDHLQEPEQAQNKISADACAD